MYDNDLDRYGDNGTLTVAGHHPYASNIAAGHTPAPRSGAYINDFVVDRGPRLVPPLIPLPECMNDIDDDRDGGYDFDGFGSYPRDYQCLSQLQDDETGIPVDQCQEIRTADFRHHSEVS